MKLRREAVPVNMHDVFIGLAFTGFAVCCALRIWHLLRIEAVLMTDERRDLPRGNKLAHILDPFAEFRWARALQASEHPRLGHLGRSLGRVLVCSYVSFGLVAAFALTRSWD